MCYSGEFDNGICYDCAKWPDTATAHVDNGHIWAFVTSNTALSMSSRQDLRPVLSSAIGLALCMDT